MNPAKVPFIVSPVGPVTFVALCIVRLKMWILCMFKKIKWTMITF